MVLFKKVLNIAISAVNSNKSLLEEYQREQWDSGKDSENAKRKKYTKYTKRIKRSKGQPTNRVTLKDKGKLYRSVKGGANRKGIYLRTNDENIDKLVEKYGENTIGLNDKRMKEFLEKTVLKAIKSEFT